MVSIEDDICQNCGERFREHPEIRAKKREMHADIKRDAINLISIMTIVISLFLLFIVLMLDNLHRWIRPIEQDSILYLGLATSGMIVALWLFVRNMRVKEVWGIPSRKGRLIPFVIAALSSIGTILLLFADEVDRFLDTSASSLLPLLMMTFALGLVLLMISRGSSSGKKERNMA